MQYVQENAAYACKESPMQLILHYADSWAGFIMEGKQVQAASGKAYEIVYDDKVGYNGDKVRVNQAAGTKELWR